MAMNDVGGARGTPDSGNEAQWTATFVRSDGSGDDAAIMRPGDTLMTAAFRMNIAGILAECGGTLSCGTCHVYVESQWADTVGPPEGMEDEMLSVLDGRLPSSRLSCQIVARAPLDGIVVRVAES